MLLKFLKIFKYLLITIVILIFLGIAAVFILYSVKKEHFKQIIIEDINQKINAALVTSSVDFTIFHDFPNVTIKLSDVKLILKGSPSDTIANIKEAAISFDIVQLWHQKLKIQSVTLNTGKLLYSEATKNYIDYFNHDTSSKSMYISINYIGLKYINLTYNLDKTYFNANIEQYKLRIKTKNTASYYDNKLKLSQ
ncbi:MAG TPA: AsmA family protein, partial [Bacteroidales bacterium]